MIRGDSDRYVTSQFQARSIITHILSLEQPNTNPLAGPQPAGLSGQHFILFDYFVPHMMAIKPYNGSPCCSVQIKKRASIGRAPSHPEKSVDRGKTSKLIKTLYLAAPATLCCTLVLFVRKPAWRNCSYNTLHRCAPLNMILPLDPFLISGLGN